MENIELKKHSGLIAMSNRNISVPQRKLYNAILYLSAKQLQEDSDRRIFKLRFSDIIKFSGYNDFSNRMFLKDSIKNLVETVVEYNILGKDRVNEWGVFALLSQANIKEFDEFMTIEFPSLILDNIEVPNIYALLNLSVVNSLSGKYSLPLYELLADYKKVLKLNISIEKLKELIGVGESEYKKIGHLKERVLNPSIAEINEKTDLTVSYITEKIESRSITHVNFSIIDKFNQMNPVESSAYHLLKSKGLSESTAKKFAKQLSKKNILDAIESLEKAIKRGSVKNIQAYLTHLLQNIDDEDGTNSTQPESALQLKLPIATSDYRPIIEDSMKSLEFKEYTKNKVNEIVRTLSFDVIEEFIRTQNDFAIHHLHQLGLIDEHKEIINLKLLKENFLFLGWVEQSYFDSELEFKIFSGEIGE